MKSYKTKFTDINLIDTMGTIAKKHAPYCQSDFALDVIMLRSVAATPNCSEKSLIWMCYASETRLFSERDVFLKNTPIYDKICCHFENPDVSVLIYAVDTIRQNGGIILGNLYPIDYRQYQSHVEEIALPAECVRLSYEYGEIVRPAFEPPSYTNVKLGRLRYYTFLPAKEGPLNTILQDERNVRRTLPEKNIAEYLAKI